MPELTQADGQLDHSHPWQQPATWNNTQDRVAWQRAFDQGTVADVQMAQCLQMADPAFPEEAIRDTLTVEEVPARTGYDRGVPGIDMCFGLGVGSPDTLTDPTGRTSEKGSLLSNHYEVM